MQFGQWLVDSGEFVLAQDRVAEILVGCVLFHVSAPAEGILQHVVEREGIRLRPRETLGFVHVAPVDSPPR